jgi:DNA repair photolyase
MIPGLSDELIPKTLKLAKAAGAQWAWGGLIRLPGAVGPFFERRLREAYPNQVDRVLNRIRSTRGGKLNATTFGSRMQGSGEHWRVMQGLFTTTAIKLQLGGVPPFPKNSPFRRPGQGIQMKLF